eukprot:scaffold96578_cov52-Cyclotella_meneghiniana.AAC.1
MLEAFNDVYEELASKGFKPKLHIMDNQCSKAVVKQIKAAGVDIQLVPPVEHKPANQKHSFCTYLLNGMDAHQECTHPSSTVSITGVSKQIPRRFMAATPDQFDWHSLLYD